MTAASASISKELSLLSEAFFESNETDDIKLKSLLTKLKAGVVPELGEIWDAEEDDFEAFEDLLGRDGFKRVELAEAD